MAHLWAIGFDEAARADHLRTEFARLASEKHALKLIDVALAVRYPDGPLVVFVLDEEGDMDAILRVIRGLGGTVLKTNVDLERAKLIQSTLAARADTIPPR